MWTVPRTSRGCAQLGLRICWIESYGFRLIDSRLNPSGRHSGARAKRGSPESIPTVRGYGFRARRFAAPRNDDRVNQPDAASDSPLQRPLEDRPCRALVERARVAAGG